MHNLIKIKLPFNYIKRLTLQLFQEIKNITMLINLSSKIMIQFTSEATAYYKLYEKKHYKYKNCH